MKVLVVGGGGREHALAWRFAGDPEVDAVLVAPGNPGCANVARLAPVDSADAPALAALAERERVHLTVVGPELPLSCGVADVFAQRGLRIFGPTRAAARLETSKAFAKNFMARHGVPTARYRECTSAAAARTVVASGELGFPIVVKADGLAAGKGVVIAADAAAALEAIGEMMEDRRFGDAGSRVVLEECLTGPELSFFAICDGRGAQPCGSAHDHKRALDDDRGPNTGGMGAYAPSPLLDAALQSRIMGEIVDPVVRGMREEGMPYVGFLYAGLMLTCAGPKVIEFNARFGDPEAQVVIPLLEGSLARRLSAAADGSLDPAPVTFCGDKAVGVVLASRGYPAPGPTGLPIRGLDTAEQDERVVVFHSGTRRGEQGEILTAGGRVLTVVGRGASYDEAIDTAYRAVSSISFDGTHYRRDIARRALHA